MRCLPKGELVPKQTSHRNQFHVSLSFYVVFVAGLIKKDIKTNSAKQASDGSRTLADWAYNMVYFIKYDRKLCESCWVCCLIKNKLEKHDEERLSENETCLGRNVQKQQLDKIGVGVYGTQCISLGWVTAEVKVITDCFCPYVCCWEISSSKPTERSLDSPPHDSEEIVFTFGWIGATLTLKRVSQ